MLRLGIGVGARMVLGAGRADGRRLGVDVGAGVEQHFGQRVVAADGGDHQRRQAVLADRVDLGGRQQLQRVRDQVRSRRAQHLEGQVDFQFSVNNKRKKTNNERKQRVDHDYLTASNL